MAYENGTGENKRLVYGPEYWTLDRVIHWLEMNDFKTAIELFKAKNICGKAFLDIDMSFLNSSEMPPHEVKKIAHAIKVLRASSDPYYNSIPPSHPYNNQRYLHSSNSSSNLNARYNNGSRYPMQSHGDRLQVTDSVIPLIPERTSSNNEQVLDWVKSFNIPKNPIVAATSARLNNNVNTNRNGFPISASSNAINNSSINPRFPISPSSPRIGDNNDGHWKFVRRRPNNTNNGQLPMSATSPNINQHYMEYPSTFPTPPPLTPQQQQYHQQFIHVTKDSETFLNLQVTGMHDPRLIKNTILRKLGLEVKCEKYHFFHENGSNSDIALTDSELSHLCQISDHSSTNRILVKPADHALEYYKSYSKDGTNCYDFAIQGGYQRRYPYNESRPMNSSNYNSDYDLNRTRYDLSNNGMISPINGNSQYNITTPDGLEEYNREDSGYFERSERTSRKQSIDNDAGVWSTNPSTQMDRTTPPLWNVTPQSQRSSTSSVDNQKHYPQNQLYQQPYQPVQSTSDTSLSSSLGDNTNDPNALWPVYQEGSGYTQEPPPPHAPSLWAVPPKQHKDETLPTSQSLWAIPPSHDMNSAQTSAQQQQKPVHNLTSSVSLWAVAPSNVTAPTSSSSLWAIPPQEDQQDTNQKITPSVSLWAVPPPQQQQEKKMSSSTSLWAVAPQQQQQQQEQEQLDTSNKNNKKLPSSVSLWAVAPQQQDTQKNQDTNKQPQKMSSSVSLWAVAPTNTQTSSPAPSLWAVPPKQEETLQNQYDNQEFPSPQFDAETLNLHPSISSKTFDSPKRREVRFAQKDIRKSPSVSSAPALEDGIESITLSDPPVEQIHHSHSSQQLHIDTNVVKNESDEDSKSPLSSPSCTTSESTDEENWAERPSVERLYKDIDKYLPGHDLDKEIIIESNQNSPNATLVAVLPPGRKLGGHKKSIRNVANEAHRKWKNAINVVRANNLLRRRSTKMWHRTVEQVKPGMSTKLFTGDAQVPKSKKLQWIRGELIGKGSFGRVYHALNVEVGEWIAVKQVDLPTTKADYNNPQLRETKDALFREISLLEDLDNEYIVQYLGYNVDEDEGHLNIFLEYVPGGSISSCLAKTGKFEIPLVRFFTRQILMGLAYLHNRNILHRDIKAGNILLDQNGTCKITDFGLSKLSGQDKAYDPHSNNSVMRGTVFWMAPEVVKGTNYNAKIDIWSLGCTVIEMMTGKHPWLDLTMLAALYSLGKYQAPPIPEDIPEEATDFLTKCFTINPEERPTAHELLTHPFVQPDSTFEFKKYMKKAEIERRASKRLQAIPVEN